jgi:hypothetical protein
MIKNVRITLRVDKVMMEQVCSLAEERGQKESECLRDLIEAGLMMLGGSKAA